MPGADRDELISIFILDRILADAFSFMLHIGILVLHQRRYRKPEPKGKPSRQLIGRKIQFFLGSRDHLAILVQKDFAGVHLEYHGLGKHLHACHISGRILFHDRFIGYALGCL